MTKYTCPYCTHEANGLKAIRFHRIKAHYNPITGKLTNDR